ncbi:hypothetical protein MMC07_000222 [Pseudocyphellaria aurata]|nr:hypothetical protein [Pseudocyphellaria aurata]
MSTFPLTTTFSPPPNCLKDVYRYNDNQLLGPMSSNCYPQGWTNSTTAVYSPGICPAGYTTACISAITANTVTETVATCCPSNFRCGSQETALGCQSSIDGGQQTQLITVVKTDDFSKIAKTEYEVIGGNMNAYGIQIRFQATDLQHTTTTSSTPITSSTSSPGATTPPNSTPTPTSTSNPTTSPPPSSGLSPGAKAGIGVGAALAVCIGLVLAWLCWQRAKRRRALPAYAGDLDGTGKSEPQRFNDGKAAIPEMHGYALSEAPGDDPRPEFQGHYAAHRHELQGNER